MHPMNNIVKMLAVTGMALLSFLLSCGKTSVTVDEDTYDPKIVVQGLLHPGKPIQRVYINRNFPVNQTIDREHIPLENARASVTDLTSGASEILQYEADSAYYKGQTMVIQHEHTYRLQVEATVEDQLLTTQSTTTIPARGFAIDAAQSCKGDIIYRQPNADGRIRKPCIVYQRSRGVELYVLSIVALDADSSTFIRNNPYGIDLKFVSENFEAFKFEEVWSPNEPQTPGISRLEIPWLDIWFYGRYRAILYAADRNFYEFFATHDNVQDFDGNLREPYFNFEGDGIGVFGSAITDTIHFNIVSGTQRP
ncbi:MAG: DUF4249 family protein [Caldithrix sp.]|nr:DUF4249 family protein [Caldithrix sp.]